LLGFRDVVELCKPEQTCLHVATGPERGIPVTCCDLLVKQGTFTPLNENAQAPKQLSLARSHPSRCGSGRRPALHCHHRHDRKPVPTNNWVAGSRHESSKMARIFQKLHGRPDHVHHPRFSMGPRFRLAVLQDRHRVHRLRPYVVGSNMAIMDQGGPSPCSRRSAPCRALFIPCLHSVGAAAWPPLSRADVALGRANGTPSISTSCTSPKDPGPSGSYGSGLRGQRSSWGKEMPSPCVSAVVHGRATRAGWPRHMLILGLHLARGARLTTSAGAFPSACGAKTNLAMMQPTLPGVGRSTCVGDGHPPGCGLGEDGPPVGHEPPRPVSSASRARDFRISPNPKPAMDSCTKKQ